MHRPGISKRLGKLSAIHVCRWRKNLDRFTHAAEFVAPQPNPFVCQVASKAFGCQYRVVQLLRQRLESRHFIYRWPYHGECDALRYPDVAKEYLSHMYSQPKGQRLGTMSFPIRVGGG